jgi:hypothetical protein
MKNLAQRIPARFRKYTYRALGLALAANAVFGWVDGNTAVELLTAAGFTVAQFNVTIED